MGRLRNGVGVGISNIPTLSSRRPFSPLSLFADGSQGVWYDDSNTATMFQNSNGTTDAVLESPVGFQFDLSKNLALGVELNGDPTLSGNGFWGVTDASITIGSGKISYATSSLSQAAYKTALLTSERTYKVTITIANFVSGGVQVQFSSALSASSSPTYSANGTYVSYITANGSIAYLTTKSAGTTLDITSISIQQIQGNHRTQATSAYRPILSARYNGLQKTEDWSTSPWTFTSFPAAITPNAGTDPLGGNKASQVVFSAQYQNVGQNYSTVIGVSYTYRFWAKVISGNTSLSGVISGLTGNAPFTATSDWTVISLPFVATASTVQVGVQDRNASGFGTLQVFGADLRPTNQATGLIPTYQRVDTSSVYDTVGFPQYIKYDGLNSSLSTASINFTANAQMNVFSGARKLSDVISGVIAELSVAFSSNNGCFLLATSGSVASDYYLGTRGTVNKFATKTGFSSPTTNVIAGISSISAPSVVVRVNGVAGTADTTSQGTGNYGNYPLYFGARAGTSIYFNGQEFQTIIVGKTLTATEIANTETYVNSKTLAY